MRVGLTIAVILGFFLTTFLGCNKEPRIYDLLRSTNCKSTVLAWGKHHKDFPGVFEYNHDGNNIIVFLFSTGSIANNHHIYIYGKAKDQDEWSLILFRPTHKTVEVQEEDGKLKFRTAKGDLILEQSLDFMGPINEIACKKNAAKKEKTSEKAGSAEVDNDKSTKQATPNADAPSSP